MLSIYIRTAWRNVKSCKSASMLNLTGLSLGMAAAVIILSWVQHEINFDTYHPNADRTYYLTIGNPADTRKFGGTPFLLAETVKQQIPELEQVSRVLITNQVTSPVLKIRNSFYREKNLVFVDKEWFSLFQYDFIYGDAGQFSKSPNGVVITKSLAQKYFGTVNVKGETIHTDSNIYQVKGVVEDNPANSSFQFDIFLPMEGYLAHPSTTKDSWELFDCQTFVTVKQNVNVKQIERKIGNIILYQEQIRNTSGNTSSTNTVSATLIQLPDIHFDKRIADTWIHQGNKNVVLIFSILGLIILGVACINYINFSTAKASGRGKEVSIKKIMGAGRKSLFTQFIVESFLTSLISLTLTLIIVWLSIPWINRFFEKGINFSFMSLGTWKILLGTLTLSVILTGVYPALLLSSFKPLNVLKGVNLLETKDAGLRKILVVCQFTAATILIVCTIVILKQMNFIDTDDEAYNRNQIFSVSLPSSWSRTHRQVKKIDLVQSLKNELKRETAIDNVTVSNDAVHNLKMSMVGIADWTGKKRGMDVQIAPLTVDGDFKNIFKLQIKEGRWFQADNANDKRNYILNETAASAFGLLQPYVGQYFSLFGDTGSIIGIVKDFHFRDYRQKIGAAVLISNPEMQGTFFVEAGAGKIKHALTRTEATWKKFFPQQPFEYSFMNEEFENMYRSDIQTSKMVAIFSGIAIFISCLGLFGLVSFMAEKRTKEIGIRKVLGASVTNITALLTKDFTKLIVISIVIALPVAWWAMSRWLQDFAYRINISWWIFAVAASLTIVIALSTIIFQAIKAALANPVESLRIE